MSRCQISACLQEFEGIVHDAACWLDEAQSWLSAACSFTTAKSHQNHAHSLQLVLDDSRIRHALEDFRPGHDEVSAVCDVSTQEERLDQIDQQVHKMQCKIVQPLEQLLQAAGEAMEAELKTIEKNVPKIRVILSSMDNSSVPLMEHLHNQQPEGDPGQHAVHGENAGGDGVMQRRASSPSPEPDCSCSH